MSSSDGKAKISLRLKFLGLMVTLIVLAMFSYLGVALRLFQKDKKLDIYDNNQLLTKTLAHELETSLGGTLRTMRLISTRVGRESSQDGAYALFREDNNLVALRIWRGNSEKPNIELFDKEYFKPYSADPSYLNRLAQERPIPAERIRSQRLVFSNQTLPGGAPLLGVGIALNSATDKQDIIAVAHMRMDRITSTFSESALYQMMLVDSFGSLLVHSDPRRTERAEQLAKDPIVENLLRDEKFQNKTEELKAANGAQHIVSGSRLPLGGLLLISMIDKEKAFLGAKLLVEKSIFVAIAVILAAFMISILFSRTLTDALKKLYQATQRVAQGDLDSPIEVQTRDEIGALAISFRKMAQEIKRLLAETADKARMEKEIETAKLVQDNLFPKPELTFGPFQLAAFYTPASECGGDWWGHIPMGDKVVILIGDATGHGVPAALITAAAHSCCATLTKLREQNPNFNLSPGLILENLNAAIHSSAKGKIKMTFFCGVFDQKTRKLTYANASHEMPLVCKVPQDGKANEPRSRDCLDTLTGDPGPALGDGPDSKYSEHSYDLQSGDALVMYTDGLTEGRNKAREEWGENRLMRAFLKVAHLPSNEVRDQIIGGARGFYDGAPLDDDITMVVAKVA